MDLSTAIKASELIEKRSYQAKVADKTRRLLDAVHNAADDAKILLYVQERSASPKEPASVNLDKNLALTAVTELVNAADTAMAETDQQIEALGATIPTI